MALVGALEGAALLAAYVLVLRHDMTLVPVAVAASLALSRIAHAAHPTHTWAVTGATSSVVLLLALGAWWSLGLRRDAEAT
jgi:ABC-type uncharacterized transport system permease subunit